MRWRTALKSLVRTLLAIVAILSSALNTPAEITPVAEAQSAGPLVRSRIAYVYNADTSARDDFVSMLGSYGFATDGIALSTASTTNFGIYRAIVIGNDTGQFSTWGTAATVSNITNANVPVIGVGEGGWAFFGQTRSLIGWPNGSDDFGSSLNTYTLDDPTSAVWTAPNPFVDVSTVRVYSDGTPWIGEQTSDATFHAQNANSTVWGVLESDGSCFTLWGGDDGPSFMTLSGRDLFINSMLAQTCGRQVSPPGVGIEQTTVTAGAGLFVFGNDFSGRRPNTINLCLVAPTPGACLASLGTATPSSIGSFSVTNTVSTATTPGTYRVRADDGYNVAVTSTTVQVTAGGGTRVLSGFAQCPGDGGPRNLPGATVEVSSGSTIVVTTTANSDAFWSVNIAPGTYSVRYLGTDSSICGAGASVPSDGSPSVNPPQGCIDLHNHSILRAVTLTPGTSPTLEHICKQGQSLWFRVAVQPQSRLVARVTGVDGGRLPANYDLVMFRDPFQAMKPVSTTTDLTSSFAGDSFGGDSFGGDSFGGDSFGGDSFGGDSFGGDSFGGDSFGGDSFGGDSFGGDSFGGDSFGGDSFGGDSFGGDSFGGDSFGGDSFGGDSFGGNPSLGGMSPAEFAQAIQKSVIGVSAHSGTQREGLWHNTWDNFTDVPHNTGWFYLRVRGRGGAYSLDAPVAISSELFTGICNTINPALGVSSLGIPGGSFHTLILTNTSRFPGQDTSALITSLNLLAAEPTITGTVVDLGTDGALTPAYVQWDGNRACPTAANIVSDGIKSYITRFRAAHPETASIVFAGPDAALPFRRVPDLSTLAKESMYVPPVFDASATQASLRLGYFLTQDFYISSHPIEKLDHDLFLPDSNMATGRLIETVPEIANMIDAYRSAGGHVAPTTALVTGYNFFTSSAQNIHDQLAQTGKTVNSTDTASHPLIQPGAGLPTDPTAWRASDLRDALATNPGLISLNAHGTRPDTIKAADYSPLHSNDLLTMAGGIPGFLRNTFIWSEACHSSFNIPDGAAIPGITPTPEIAEVLSQLGATVVGGTGYQYGDTDTIQYTTQIMVNLTTELRYGSGPVPVGQALVNAKLTYANSIIDFKGIHEKSILESTLYGIPDFSVDLGPTGRLTRPTETPLFGPADLQLVSNFPGRNPNLNLRTTDLNLNFAPQRNDVTLANLSGGSTTASYFSLNGLTQANPNEPLLPRFVTPLHLNTNDNTLVRGAVFLGGNFADIPGFTPLTAQPSDQLRDPHRPFLSETEFPQRLERINYFSGEHLVLTPAQYVSGIDPNTGQRTQSGTERVFSNINTRLYYSTLLTQTITADNQTFQAVLAGPPAIISQRGVPNGSNINFEVNVSVLPNIGVQDVFITSTNTRLGEGHGSWSSIQLVQDPPTSPSKGLRWTGSLPVPSGSSASDLRYIIQAVSGAGLVTVSTNFGAFYTPQVLPTTITPRKTTALAIVSPTPTTAIARRPITVAAQLTDASNASGIAGKKVVFNLGGERGIGFTSASGVATAQLQVYALPGSYSVDASFDEDDGDLGSDAKAPLTISKESTQITLAVTPTTAAFHSSIHVDSTLTDGLGRRLREQSVFFLIADGAGVVQQAFQDETDFSGNVHTDIPLGLAPGTYSVTAAFAGVIQLPGGQSVDLTNTRYNPARSPAVALTVNRNFSLQVDGSTGYASAPAAPKLNITGNWTVEAWFKDEDPNGFNHDFREILMKGDRDASPEAPYFVVIGNNHLLAGVRTGGVDYPIDANLAVLGLNPQQWHHVAVTFRADLNVLNLWLDGVHISFQTVPAHSVTGNALPLQIGRNGPTSGKYWMGKLDDVRVWNIARDGTDISSTFQSELTGAPAGLVGNWRFNEGSGLTAADSGVPPAADATLTGGASFSTDVHP